MPLLPKGKDWFADYLLLDQFAHYGHSSGAFALSPHLIADVLTILTKDYIRFNVESNQWYRFNNQVWEPSDTVFSIVMEAITGIKNRLLQAAKDAKKPMDGLGYAGIDNLTSGKFPYEVIRSLEHHSELFIDMNEFDADMELLNCPGSVINLVTQKKTFNEAKYYCRHMTSVAPLDDEDGRKCPYYMDHLKFMAEDDPSIVEYLENIAGYILTGKTSFHQFYWMFGLKNNGKSSLVNIWRYILGDIAPTSYFQLAPQDLFAKNQNKPHPQIFMRFIGKRMVLVDEFDGDYINEALIKAFLSGSPISAREMHGSEVMFIPQCKLIFTSNHKPAFRGTDGGFTKRLHLLDFIAQIDDKKRLDEFDIRYLRPEAPYILNRMITAANRILHQPTIMLPSKFVDATAEYVGSNNIIEQYINQACETGEDKSDIFANIFKAYQMWCQTNTYEPMNANQFSRKLSDLNFKSKTVNGQRGKARIKLNVEWADKIGKAARFYAN